MKIELLSTGQNLLETIKLIREYSSLSLKEAKDIAESTPSFFICNLADEKMYEIESKFCLNGDVILIKPGIGKEKVEKFKNPLLNLLIQPVEKKENENIVLETKEQIIDYLKKNQSRSTAIQTGILSTIILTGLIGFYIYFEGFLGWWIKPLIAVIIGVAIKRSGRGVTTEFGIIAVGFTILTIVFHEIIWTIYFSKLYNSFNLPIPTLWSISITLISAFWAFHTGFYKITEKNKDKIRSQIKPGYKPADYNQTKKDEIISKISISKLDVNKSKTTETVVVNNEQKPGRRKKDSNEMPDKDDED